MGALLEVGYYNDEDLQAKLVTILAELSVGSNNLVVTGYDGESGNNHYILVEILEPMVDRIVDIEDTATTLAADIAAELVDIKERLDALEA